MIGKFIRNHFRKKNADRVRRNLHHCSVKKLIEASQNCSELQDGVTEVLFEELGKRWLKEKA